MYNHDEDPAGALREAYGARPDEEFIREAWPTLLESWLRTTKDSREWVVNALRETRGDKGSVTGRDAQIEYLRGLNNSKKLREIVWAELVAAGEVERTNEHDQDEEDRKERSQHRVEQPTATAKKPASRKPSTMNGSDGPEPGAKTRDGQLPRQTKPKEETKTLEQRLWEAADSLRGNQEPSEYKHVVLGLVFLKYITRPVRGTRARRSRRHCPTPTPSDYIPNEKPPGAVHRGPRRVRQPQRVLGARRGPLGPHPGPGQAAEHRPGHRRGDGPDREGEPFHPGRAAAQLRARGSGQGTPRAGWSTSSAASASPRPTTTAPTTF